VDHRVKPGDDSICALGWIASLPLAMTEWAICTAAMPYNDAWMGFLAAAFCVYAVSV
jgi:hypothetical protein